MNSLDKLNELLGAGFSVNEARTELYRLGYSGAQINAAMESHQNESKKALATRSPLLGNRYVPLVLLILNCVVFFVLLPGAVAAENSSLFAILGGAITLLLCFWTFKQTTPGLTMKFPALTIVTATLSLFVFGILFVYRAASFQEQDLEKHGVTAMARIVDKTCIPGRRGNALTSIKVVFQTDSKGLAEASIDISKREYSQLEEGMEIPVLYSEENPGIAVIARERTLERYRK